ncbi:hypothetical protein CYMTET_53808 [Cymbomonas tetramitiformis]|uniref:Uncharacterized protein n=1 Tax=Cymbomonas tetramitiformis TaxID=36881 RepID=A0AAE0BHE7_9CHLO|nr:hypothetical protein CYMTET_53808 [Cymbomonas tetramitiformis]|eukprot:gene20533-biopygen21170
MEVARGGVVELQDDSSLEDANISAGDESDEEETIFSIADFGNADGREFFVVKASARDEFTFRFKIANRLSPHLSLMECMEVRSAERKNFQAYYKPTSSAFVGNSKKRQVSLQSASKAHAFSNCKYKITECVPFDGESIFWAWEEDESGPEGSIPREQAHELYALLARTMKSERVRARLLD